MLFAYSKLVIDKLGCMRYAHIPSMAATVRFSGYILVTMSVRLHDRSLQEKVGFRLLHVEMEKVFIFLFHGLDLCFQRAYIGIATTAWVLVKKNKMPESSDCIEGRKRGLVSRIQEGRRTPDRTSIYFVTTISSLPIMYQRNKTESKPRMFVKTPSNLYGYQRDCSFSGESSTSTIDRDARSV